VRRFLMFGALAAGTIGMQGCMGGHGGGGGSFLALVIIGLLVVIVIKLFRESEATSDSLISIEGQLRRLNSKIDELTGESTKPAPAKKKAAKKTASKKTTSDS